MQISKQIGVYKREHNLPVLQEKRYAKILKNRLDWARKNGLDDEVVQRIMEALHEESCRWQL
jgi:chorismate mutase